MCKYSAMKEVKQNENCIDTARTFTTENNVIAIPPSLLPAIQSLDKRQKNETVSLFCNNHPGLIHSSAAGTAQERSSVVKRKIWENKNKQ